MNRTGVNQHSGEQWAGSTTPGQVQAYALSNINRNLDSFVLAAAACDVPTMLQAARSMRRVCTRLESYARTVGRKLAGKENAKDASHD
jgi:hypothetical protein